MLKKILQSKLSIFIFVNTLIILFQVFLLSFFYSQMNNEIPFWYTANWGLEMLTDKRNIIIIPFISVVITILSSFLFYISKNY